MKTCPVDNAQLMEINKSGVMIDVCPECKGVWLDRGELEKIVNVTKDLEAEFNRDQQRIEPRAATDRDRYRDEPRYEARDDRYRRSERDDDDDDRSKRGKKGALGRIFDIFD
jgi:uncharacterized protein